MVTIQHSADNIVENMRIFRIFSTFQQNLRSKRAWDRISNDIWFYIFCCIKAGLCVWTPAVHTAVYLNQVTKSFCVGSNLGLWSGLNTFSHSPRIQHVIQCSQLSHLTMWTCSILEKGGWLHPDFGFIRESRSPGIRPMTKDSIWSGEISCPILIPHSVSALICSIAVHTLFIGEFVNSANRASPAHISEESRNQTYDTWLDLVSAPVWCPDVRSIHYLLEWTLKHKSVPALAQFLFSNW